MKIILAYDGSVSGDSTIDDLSRAGLPRHGKALILCVGHAGEPPQPLSEATVRKIRSQIPEWKIS